MIAIEEVLASVASGAGWGAGFPPPNQPRTWKNTGVRKMPKAVTPSIPENTAVPSDRRISV
jgi:hypothetical protein